MKTQKDKASLAYRSQSCLFQKGCSEIIQGKSGTYEYIWIARICGVSKHMKFQREYCSRQYNEERHCYEFDTSTPGIYQCQLYTNFKLFEIAEDGSVSRLTNDEVLERFGISPVEAEHHRDIIKRLYRKYPIGYFQKMYNRLEFNNRIVLQFEDFEEFVHHTADLVEDKFNRATERLGFLERHQSSDEQDMSARQEKYRDMMQMCCSYLSELDEIKNMPLQMLANSSKSSEIIQIKKQDIRTKVSSTGSLI